MSCRMLADKRGQSMIVSGKNTLELPLRLIDLPDD